MFSLWQINAYLHQLFSNYFQGALEPKDGVTSVHVGTPQTPAYYPYEYTFGQYPYERYRWVNVKTILLLCHQAKLLKKNNIRPSLLRTAESLLYCADLICFVCLTCHKHDQLCLCHSLWVVITKYHFICRHRQLYLFWRRFPSQKCHPRDHQHPEGLAAGAPEEPLPHKGGEDNACYHHQDDPHTSKIYSLTKEISNYSFFVALSVFISHLSHRHALFLIPSFLCYCSFLSFNFLNTHNDSVCQHDIQDFKRHPDHPDLFSHTGFHLVRERTQEAEEREQGDVVAAGLQKLGWPRLWWRQRRSWETP